MIFLGPAFSSYKDFSNSLKQLSNEIAKNMNSSLTYLQDEYLWEWEQPDFWAA